MSQIKPFQDRSYRQHSESYRVFTKDSEQAAHAKTWFDRDTVDAWRHKRMYQTLDPILATEPQATWLTVGDGRYGGDAKYIEEKGGSALATDISEHLLKEAKEMGYLTNYQVENAESLSFQESTFDYVFCKEAYHHFPRPMLALYEMMRVSKKGVVLIEPNDSYIADGYLTVLFRNLKDVVKGILNKAADRHAFEESGNYVFSISRREVEKVALGLNYRTVAFKGINDIYVSGVEYEKISANGHLQKKVKRSIGVRDFLCKLRVLDYVLLSSIIFKKKPSKELLQQLAAEGYEIVELPDNPYISG